jgi:hypothetical protein
LINGETYYTGIEFPLDFSLTVRENSSWTAYQYFQSWWNDVFDQDTLRFRSYRTSIGTGVIKGSVDDKIHRHGSITFFGWHKEGSSSVSIRSGTTKEVVSSIDVPDLIEDPIYTFKMTNIKLTGFESVPLGYEGGVLRFQVSMCAEDIRGEKSSAQFTSSKEA